MLDGFGREIDYLRVSVTDRCDLRCVYCMPEDGVPCLSHAEVLRYEEILRIVRICASLGIRKIRLTGGEPLVRRDLPSLVAELKAVEGIETVALTTNGLLLEEQLPALLASGLDAVNISIDAVDEAVFQQITRRRGLSRVLTGIGAALAAEGLTVKLNCVPTRLNEEQLIPLVRRFLPQNPIPLRFIELMPLGPGGQLESLPEAAVRARLEAAFGPLRPLTSEDPREKCSYFALADFAGRVGFISALSHQFCGRCNRVRLMADGYLKTCLQYGDGVALRPLLTGPDDALREAIAQAIGQKPARHHFAAPAAETRDERRGMSQIGG